MSSFPTAGTKTLSGSYGNDYVYASGLLVGNETLASYIGDTLVANGGVNLEKLIPDATYISPPPIAPATA